MVDSNIDNNNNNNNNINNNTRIPENSVTELSTPTFNANANDVDVDEEDEIIAKMFTGQNMIYLGIFIVVFWFTYISMRKSNSGSSIDTRMVDFIIFGLLIITMLFFYLKNRNVFFTEEFWKKKTTGFIEYLDEDYSFVNNVLILFGLYMVVYLLNVPMSVHNKPISITIIESIMVGLIIITGFVLFFRYILGVQLMDIITDIIKTLGGEEQKKDKVSEEDKGTPDIVIEQKEVFNVGDNKYTYKEAEAVCRVFDAEVASFDQVEKAYNDGGEWCNYGWTKGQMALFPTQKSTWKKLQKDPKHKNDCGRPGINGGYFKNPYLKFGVNCYGIKREQTETDTNRMKMNRISPHKRSKEDKEMDKKVEEWKKNKKDFMINSYNNTTWSKY